MALIACNPTKLKLFAQESERHFLKYEMLLQAYVKLISSSENIQLFAFSAIKGINIPLETSIPISHFRSSMIVTLEGFTLPSGYVIKELTALNVSNDEYQHFHFNAPENFKPTHTDLQTINYATRYLNQLSLSDDSLLPYAAITAILQNLVKHTIYVAGHSAYSFIKSHLPLSNIIDITSTLNFKYPKILNSADCFKTHRPRYCSLAKARCIKKFMLQGEF